MTPEVQEELVRMWNDDILVSEIAKAINYSEAYVMDWAGKHRDRCPARRTRGMSQDAKDIIVRMWNAGEPVKKISSATGYAVRTIHKWTSQHRDLCEMRYGGLTKQRSEEIRRLRDSGMTWLDIASTIGVSSSTLTRWRRFEKEM